ncbi:transposase, putative [Ixodes scapularis]|uniref:Transposase, putative n=1 Tax=Ixodes scapularis TaxID=6945 RepID=B7QKT5_IXOSC|nr:transposase, putative [Ixodes scapularis]|eukprot:XP_002415790.1 transposase, putative [Ixodes scapularis]
MSVAASNVKRCRVRGSTFPDVEEALVLWLKKARTKNLPVSGPLLLEKARFFATQLHHDDFVCSNGWLSRFRARYNIATRVISGKGAAADTDGAEEWQNGQLQQILTDYAPEDIFNLDESALFFRLLPNRTLVSKGQACTGGKHAKDRISVAFIVNMTGSEKPPLLVIGKSEKPRCFKGGRLPSGVLYRSNTKAWMTAKIFEEYVRLLDRRFAAKKRNVIVVLDNASAHVQVENLSAIKLVFLAPITTALAQPLDQGIIRAVKQTYRKNLLRRMLLSMENNKSYAVELLSGIRLLAYSWQQVEPST